MAVNKKEEFSEQDNNIASFAKALSHPARVSILKTLAEKNTCICGEIVDVMPLSQSTVSQHLKELRNAGLIVGKIDGTASCYFINWENLDKELNDLNMLAEFLRKKSKTYKCCT